MSTTPIDPIVQRYMHRFLFMDRIWGNAASRSHMYGWVSRDFISESQKMVSSLINSKPEEIIWTSGATESNNLAIKGAAEAYKNKGKHIITLSTEHKSVLCTFEYLSSRGFEVEYLQPNKEGFVNLEEISNVIKESTILLSIAHVNSETGIIQNIKGISNICRKKGVIMHSDCAQSSGKTVIDVRDMNVDLVSLSSHKAYGPKGAGALFISRQPKVILEKQIHGGSESGKVNFRSGTLATHQICGMGKAFEICDSKFYLENKRISTYRKYLWDNIKDIPGIGMNGSFRSSVPHCLNIYIDKVESNKLIKRLSDIAISSGSACSSSFSASSHVLSSMKLPEKLLSKSIRISLGRFTTENEIHFLIERLRSEIRFLRNNRSYS